MKVLDLFSGIGGFSLGLERAGMQTVAFCEIDPKARKVLNKHWPSVNIYSDIRELNSNNFKDIDVICGGFPCQDISNAGKGEGLEGKRSGLWWEFHRLIKEIKPKYAIIENVSALRNKGLDQILMSLHEIGYDAEWHCIPANSIGAKHRRDRIWIISYPNKQRTQVQVEGSKPAEQVLRGSSEAWRATAGQVWSAEPSVDRVVDGFPGRVDRIRQLGNAVVPQIPEIVGKAIMLYENNK